MKHLKTFEQHLKIFKIPDLAEVLSYQFGYDAEFYYDVFLKQLSSEFRRNGDEGVIKVFKQSSGGLTLTPISKGKYTI